MKNIPIRTNFFIYFNALEKERLVPSYRIDIDLNQFTATESYFSYVVNILMF